MTDWDGMSEEGARRRLDEAFTRLRAVAAAEEHVLLEQVAASTPDFSWPPAPNTVHPWMASKADFVRGLMAKGEYRVLLAAPRKPLYRFISEPEQDPSTLAPADDVLHLDVRRCMGAAPFVGDPFVYVWKVAVDKYNRWVAGESRPEYMPWSVQVRRGYA